MANLLLPILPGNLPSGYCFTTWQALLVDLADNMKAVLENGRSYYNYGDTKPDPEYQAYPWLRTTDMRWYSFDGLWKSLNPEQSSLARRLWVGTEAELITYDGGSPGAVTVSAGPMWTVDTEFNGRSPMAPGSIPGVDPVKTLGVEENYGTGQVTITPANIPSTGLYCKARGALGTDLDPATQRFLADYASPGSGGGALPEIQLPVESTVGTSNMDKPIVTVPPVRGCYLIKRTARQFYVVP